MVRAFQIEILVNGMKQQQQQKKNCGNSCVKRQNLETSFFESIGMYSRKKLCRIKKDMGFGGSKRNNGFVVYLQTVLLFYVIYSKDISLFNNISMC